MPRSSRVMDFIEASAYGRRNDLPAFAVRLMLRGLSGVYSVVILLYLLPFKTGLRRKHRLRKPVISVGNITVGGTGKTPVVQYICSGLAERGEKPAVLSYGYGGKLAGSFGIVSDGSEILLDSATAGDEPRMLADSMPGIPVVVGKHRHESGIAAIDQLGAGILVLDDGFQVWKLHHDLDIVLVNALSPIDNGYTLPAGRLREPVWALRRSDCILATGECSPKEFDRARLTLSEIAPGIPVFKAGLSPDSAYMLSDRAEIALDAFRGRKVIALSSIGNPASFSDTLKSLQMLIVAAEPFPDHHRYTSDDIAYIEKRAAENTADFIVTTEKDAVKLEGLHFKTPVAVMRVKLKLDDETRFWEVIYGSGVPRPSL